MAKPTAAIICESPSKFCGNTLSNLKASSTPLEFTRVSITVFQGQTTFNDPIMNPVRTAIVWLWYFLKSQVKTCEKLIKPKAAPIQRGILQLNLEKAPQIIKLDKP